MDRKAIEKTFTDLIRQNERIIHKVCFLYAHTDTDRKDLYQEIISRTWLGFPKFKGNSKFSTWLYQVAINTALGSLKQEKRSVIKYTLDVMPVDAIASDSNHIQTEQLELLHAAINQLNEIERAIVMLYLDDKSYEEMETIMGIPNGALRVKMSRIKEKLRQLTKN